MIWIPVAFACLMNGSCSFYHGTISVSLEQCEEQNKRASVAMSTDADVQAYQVDCLEIKPNTKDYL